MQHICAKLNQFIELKLTLSSVAGYINRITSCDALGIRLKEGEDYPYYLYHGFSEAFINNEGSLQDKENGNLLCLCGQVIGGDCDLSKPYFTANGSFWTNDFPEAISHLKLEASSSLKSTLCSDFGQDSMCLVPIKVLDERLGLIQIADREKGLFTQDSIEYLEMLAEHIGVAVQASLNYKQQANIDSLTNVFNRTGLFSTANLLAFVSHHNGYNMGAIIIEIDNFAELVKSHGEQAANKILKKVVTTIRDNMRCSDILGRYDIDKILIFLSPVETSVLADIAAKAKLLLESQTEEEIPLTINIGISDDTVTDAYRDTVGHLVIKAKESLLLAKIK